MSKTIHIIGAGGPAGVGITRCLKDHYTVTGEDSSQWAELMMECPDEGSFLKDLYIPLPDSVIEQYVHMKSRNSPKYFLPPVEHIEICQDKARTAKLIGDFAPKVYWVRDTHGAGGAGAQMAQEFLPGFNYSHEVVYFKGKLLAYFQKRRVSYSVKSKTQGVDNRGSSAVSICTYNKDVEHAALCALNKLPGQLHGFYGVDLKCDENKVPKVTEINAGRLLTASYAFFSETSYNLPLVGMKAFFGEELPELPDYPLGIGQIRQVGQQPHFFPPEVTKDW